MVRNPSACRISYRDRRNSWCGSGGIAGYDDDGSALILTNAHVSGSPSAEANRTARFQLADGRFVDHDASEILAYGFSDRLAVDWAVLRCPGIGPQSGFGFTPLSINKPTNSAFTFSGSPNCIWPQSHIDVRLVNGSPADGVRFWQPPSIGGQSGSNLRAKIGDFEVTELLLTWIWNGNGAGQETSQIFNNIVNANTHGPVRPEGLFQPPGTFETPEPMYHECARFAARFGREQRLERVQSLPIWFDANAVQPDPVDPVEPSDECRKLLKAVVDTRNKHTDAMDAAESYLERN